MKKRSFVLIFTFFVITVLIVLGGAILSRSVSESRIAQKHLEATQAFWAAEAGVSEALNALRVDFNESAANINSGATSLDQGTFSVNITNIDAENRRVTIDGSFAGVTRTIEVVISKPPLPSNLFDHAIYTSGDLTSNGSAGSVTGDIIVGDTFTDNGGTTMDAPTMDPSIDPIARLNFDDLRIASEGQNNDYETSFNGKKYYEPGTTTEKALPASFWYVTIDGIDNDEDGETDEVDEWVPNIVYIDGSLDISGKGTVGGFFIVGGDLVADASIGGSGTIDGVIYTLGDLVINGGGGTETLNINGGLLTGGDTTLNGSPTVTYNLEYMEAIENNTPIDRDPQVSSWEDKNNPYF